MKLFQVPKKRLELAHLNHALIHQRELNEIEITKILNYIWIWDYTAAHILPVGQIRAVYLKRMFMN